MIATDASIDKGAVDEEEEEDVDDDNDDDNDDNDDNDVDNSKSKKRVKNNISSTSSSTTTTKNSKRTNKTNGDVDYGVSRGIDFQDVNFVVNFDFPVTTAAYTHRVGRTGRGGSMGTSLSFASIACSSSGSSTASEIEIARRDQEVLEMIRHEQPRLNPSIYTNNILAAIGANSNSNNDEFRQSSSFSSSSSSSSSLSNDDDHLLQPSLLQFNMKELDSFRYRVEDTLRSVTNAAVKELRAAELKKEILNSEKLKSYFAENPNDLKVSDNMLMYMFYVCVMIKGIVM